MKRFSRSTSILSSSSETDLDLDLDLEMARRPSTVRFLDAAGSNLSGSTTTLTDLVEPTIHVESPTSSVTSETVCPSELAANYLGYPGSGGWGRSQGLIMFCNKKNIRKFSAPPLGRPRKKR